MLQYYRSLKCTRAAQKTLTNRLCPRKRIEDRRSSILTPSDDTFFLKNNEFIGGHVPASRTLACK